MQRKHREIVSAVLVSADNKILLGKVRAGGVYPDCWHIPGGGVEAGETNLITLQREIQEEIGLDITRTTPVLLSDSDSGEAVKTDKKTGEQWLVLMHFTVYRIDLALSSEEVAITLNDDLCEYRWVPFAELGDYLLTPPSQKLFTALGWI